MTGSTKLTENEIAAVAATVKAPQSLHRRVQAMVVTADGCGERRGSERGKRLSPTARLRLVGVGALGTAAATAIALALALSGGSSGLTVEQAAALTLSPATMGAPRESRTHHAQLEASVEGVAFPYWRERFGWGSAGARLDRAGGRSVMTVFYADASGHRIGYAIAAGRTPRLSGGAIRWSAGVPYRVSHQDGATVVAWPRKGHLCVVSGHGVSATTLLRLAGWRAGVATSA